MSFKVSSVDWNVSRVLLYTNLICQAVKQCFYNAFFTCFYFSNIKIQLHRVCRERSPLKSREKLNIWNVLSCTYKNLCIYHVDRLVDTCLSKPSMISIQACLSFIELSLNFKVLISVFIFVMVTLFKYCIIYIFIAK